MFDECCIDIEIVLLFVLLYLLLYYLMFELNMLFVKFLLVVFDDDVLVDM